MALARTHTWQRDSTHLPPDTDQNLIFLHVYPLIAGAAASGGSGGSGGAGAAGSAASAAVDRDSPTYVLTACSLDQLKRLVPSKLASYSQRKRTLGVLTAAESRLEALETQMITMARALTAAEQEEYDVTTREALGEKAAWLQGEVKAQVAAGKLTALERERVIHGMDEKLAAARAELAAAEAAGGGGKKVVALAAAIEGLLSKKAALQATPPVAHAVRGDVEMRRCLVGIANAERLRASIAKVGRLATLAEAKELGAKLDHEERLAVLKTEARGWLEEDAEFDARVDAALRVLAAAAGGKRR